MLINKAPDIYRWKKKIDIKKENIGEAEQEKRITYPIIFRPFFSRLQFKVISKYIGFTRIII